MEASLEIPEELINTNEVKFKKINEHGKHVNEEKKAIALALFGELLEESCSSTYLCSNHSSTTGQPKNQMAAQPTCTLDAGGFIKHISLFCSIPRKTQLWPN